MADRNISKEYKEYQKQREARIMRRVKAYIDGEFTLDDFYGLERLDADDDRFNGFKETAAQLEDLNTAEKAEEPEPVKPKSKPYPPELDYMTAEEYRKLSIAEMTRLYEAAPEKVREILDKHDRPAYMDIIDPRPKARDYKGLTVEDFKKMTLQEMQELYNADPALYNKLAGRLDRHPKAGSKAEAETSDIVAGGIISGDGGE